MNDPEIDEYGYDITLEDSFTYIPIQLKTKALSSTKSSWQIRCDFFRPSFHDQFDKNLDLMIDGRPCGMHGGCGGVVLQEFDENAALHSPEGVSYYYCDFLYILSIARGFWSSNKFSQDEAKDLILGIADRHNEERFSLPRRAFLPILSPTSILDWRLHIGQYSNYTSIFLKVNRDISDNDTALRQYRFDRSSRMPRTHAADFPHYQEKY